MADSDDPFVTFLTLLEGLPPARATEVRELKAKAMAYVWGWQDAGGAKRDSDDAYKFGLAYGIYAAEYAAEKRSSRRPIQDAFKAWQSG